MSTFDSVHWRDEAIHHLFDTIREMKRDVAHLEALVINAEMDRDDARASRDEWGRLWEKASMGVLTLQADLEKVETERDKYKTALETVYGQSESEDYPALPRIQVFNRAEASINTQGQVEVTRPIDGSTVTFV